MKETAGNEQDRSAGRARRLADMLRLGLGALLIAVLVPVLQWLGRGALGNGAELDVPTPVAIGALTALVAVVCVLRLLRRSGVFSPRTLVILYVMLTISIPFCNMGLVQGFYASLTAVASEHLDRQVMTIRKGYECQSPDFFPKLPAPAYAEYLSLADKARAHPEQIAECQARQMEVLKPLKRFWAGGGLDRQEKARLDRDGSALQRGRAAWGTIPWSVWRPVLLRWALLMALVFAAMLLLADGLTREWTERENLTFPVAQLPLGLVEESIAGGTHLGRNGFFWAGAGISCLLLLLGGLVHYRILSLPVSGAVTFQRVDFRAIFVTPPWDILANNVLFLSPLMIGLALLVHQDILKGCLWVFAVLMGVRWVTGLAEGSLREAVGTHWLGNSMPYFPELGTGAAIVFALFLLWRSRDAFTGAFGTAGGRRGLLLVVVAASIGAWWYSLGVEGWQGLVFLAFFFVSTVLAGIVLARARAEGGLPQGGTTLVGSEIAFNTGNVAEHGLRNVMAYDHSFFLGISALPGVLATQLEAFYLGRHFRISRGAIAAACVIGFVVAVGVGLLSFLVLAHAYGAQNLQPALQDIVKKPFWNTFVAGDVAYRAGSDPLRVAMIPIGAVVMALLIGLRRRYHGFPIPPVSLILICLGTLTLQRAGESSRDLQRLPINVVWGPMLLACFAKGLLLRYGGMDLYLRSRPLALGLIFGHALALVGWSLYHAVAAPGMVLFVGVFQ